MKRFTLLFACVFCLYGKLYATGDVYEKLFCELRKYPVVFDAYSEDNFPLMSGNSKMGGLLDPLGRGVANIEMADLYLDDTGRILGPGLMLKPVRFTGYKPDEYCQSYDLETGILRTSVGYFNGSYNSMLFFSHDDRDRLVYTFTNTGDTPLECNLSLGRFEMRIDGFTGNSITCTSPEGAFSDLRYTLTSNIPFGKSNFPNVSFLPWSKDIFITVKAGERLEIQVVLTVGRREEGNTLETVNNSAGVQMEKHIAQWEKNWRSIGFVVLPDGEYARTYYRSLHWLQCTAGHGEHLPGECQFGAFSTYIALEYNLRVNQNLSNITPWQQLPFTYGGAGWATLAYTWLGDAERAGNMLRAFYRPESLKQNVTTMYPSGEYEYTYGNKKKGKHTYLREHNPAAIAFGHENLHDMRNHNVPPWDKQIHIQGFAPSMYHHFNSFYGLMSDTVYSVLRGSAEFWRTILQYDEFKDRYTLPPLLSVTENLFEAGVLDGLIAARGTLTAAAEMAHRTGADKELRKQWEQIAVKIDLPSRGNIYLEFNGDDGSRAGSGYMGIRGYAYLGFPATCIKTCLSGKKVAASLDLCWDRNKHGKGMITFIANWYALTDAYWGRGEEAYEKSSYCLTQTEPHTSSMCEQEGSLYYFLTGYASFAMVPVAMVLQSDGNSIRTFPAVPKAFPDIEFYNLPAAGGIRVSGIMRAGKRESVRYDR
ncbi:MAG: hypothetical protein LBS54_00670 [Dysgonamonadaceae bacterium]|jgi:hypothetical protein|nr:hypothetical protein [Dysgonamonadaceae bacterium]